MDSSSLRGAKVVVLGLGRFGGGAGVSRWLAGQGAEVTVTDRLPASELAAGIRALEGLPIRFRLGGHDEAALRGADLVVVNPAIPPHDGVRASLARRGTPTTTEIRIFLERCPAAVVGVTGTAGKSTVTSLVGALLAETGSRVHVGGNLGGSLLDRLDRMTAGDVAVVELSSAQLEWLRDLSGLRLPTAVVTNCWPNHLDYHGTFEAYQDAKRNLLRLQGEGDTAVLDTDDPVVRTWARDVRGRRLDVGGEDAPLEAAGRIHLPDGDGFPSEGWSLPGPHNRRNLLTGLAAAWAFAGPGHGVAWERAIRAFRGLPHRLETVGVFRGVRAVNDSKATTPEGVRRALEALPGPVRILLGGSSKGLAFTGLAESVVEAGVVAAYCYGRTGPEIADCLRREGMTTCRVFPSMEEALAAASADAVAGETLLLSPGCASFDAFANYIERGERFRERVTPLLGGQVREEVSP